MRFQKVWPQRDASFTNNSIWLGREMALAPAPSLYGGISFAPAGELLKLCLLILVIVVFIFLIFKDIVKALKRRTHWIPGGFLVLSAFTIQLLNMLGSQAEPSENNKKTLTWVDFWMTHTSRVMLCVIVAYLMPAMANPRAEESWGKLLALGLTVFLSVRSEYYIVRRHGSYICSVSGCVDKDQINMKLYILFASLISLCFVMLLLLLGCANIAGRGIERILAQKIPLLLKERDDLYSELGATGSEVRDYKYHSCGQTDDPVEKEHRRRHCQRCWQKVEDAVLRRWIVARTYSREFIIARSALVSSAATIVTAQIVITIVGGLRMSPRLDINTVYDALKFTATVLQCIFIFIGWSMIEWRWITAVAYYKKHLREMLQAQKTPAEIKEAEAQASWRKEFRVEDFWTRHLRELVQAQKPRLPQAELLDHKIQRTIAKEQTSFTVPRYLLYPLIWLQWVIVAFSKVCWLTSLIIFHNRLMDKLLLFILAKHDMYALEDYPKYKKMLEEVQMLRRHPESLWVANRKSIAKAKMLILQGNDDGERKCETLIVFLAHKITDSRLGLSCLEPYKLYCETGLKFLCRKSPIQAHQQATDVMENQQSQEVDEELAVEEHLIDAGTKSWKMTAVSLLSIIIHLAPFYAEQDFPPKRVKDCMEAYSQAWEIVDFVEETDTESNLNMMNEAADRYFDILQRRCQCVRKIEPPGDVNVTKDLKTAERVREALEDLKRDCLSKTDPAGGVNMISAVGYALGIKHKKGIDGVQYLNKRWMKVGGNDSVDWETVAYGNAVYKLCNSIQFDDGADVADVAQLLRELESCLADIIYECLEKIQKLLLLNSKKWAQNTDEKRMGKALYTAGKARLIMKNLDTIQKGNDLAIILI